jgi:hypothetical protein
MVRASADVVPVGMDGGAVLECKTAIRGGAVIVRAYIKD